MRSESLKRTAGINVCIGQIALINADVRIVYGSVVRRGSVVGRYVLTDTSLAVNTTRLIRKLFDHDIIEKPLSVNGWMMKIMIHLEVFNNIKEIKKVF